MEIGEIRDLVTKKINGFMILADDGMPLVTLRAKEDHVLGPPEIAVHIHLSNVSLGASKPATDGRFKTSRGVNVQYVI